MAKNSGLSWLVIGIIIVGITGFICGIVFNWPKKKNDAPVLVETTNTTAEIPAEEPESPAVASAEEIPTPVVPTNGIVKFTMRPKLSATSQEVHSKDKK